MGFVFTVFGFMGVVVEAHSCCPSSAVSGVRRGIVGDLDAW